MTAASSQETIEETFRDHNDETCKKTNDDQERSRRKLQFVSSGSDENLADICLVANRDMETDDSDDSMDGVSSSANNTEDDVWTCDTCHSHITDFDLSGDFSYRIVPSLTTACGLGIRCCYCHERVRKEKSQSRYSPADITDSESESSSNGDETLELILDRDHCDENSDRFRVEKGWVCCICGQYPIHPEEVVFRRTLDALRGFARILVHAVCCATIPLEEPTSTLQTSL